MQQRLAVVALLGLSATVSAQTAFYSPPEMGNGEGVYYAYYLGRYPKMRQQVVDGDLRGKVINIKEIAFRLDNYSYTNSYGSGRSYANVTIDIGKGDYVKFGPVNASNFTSTPARVFSSSVTWPTLSGKPAVTPAIWGGTKGEYKFPFTSPWLYLGQSDIVTDWNFDGGKLLNGVTWSSTSSRYYRFDSYGNNSYSSNGYTLVANYPATRLNNNSAGVTDRCNDTDHGTTNTGAYTYIYSYVYGDKYPVTNYRGQMYFYTASYYTGYSNPVMHAIGALPNQTGLDLNTGCNKLHITGPMLLFPFVTMPKAYSTSGYSGYTFNLIPWNAAMAGVDLIAQAGWSDSATGKLRLTQARHIQLPAGKPKDYRRAVTYQYATYNPYGPYERYYFHPGMRYLQ